jgi:hypothetical protein
MNTYRSIDDIRRSNAVVALGFNNFSGCDEDEFTFPDGVIPPTEEAIQAKLAELHAAFPLQALREKRNQFLAETDWTQIPDSAFTNEQSAEWKLYRQKLRNLPAGLDTVDKVNAVTWPTKPE